LDALGRPAEAIKIYTSLLDSKVTPSADSCWESELWSVSKGREFPYFHGTAVMRAEEYVSPDALGKPAVRRVWVIDALYWIAPEWKATLPQPWVEVSEAAFPEWVSGNAQIIVRCYEKRMRDER